ncbi:MAG: hypothetical protein ABJA89_15040 [Lapillicoccus sp.]
MVTVLSRGEWWANLSPETQDRLAADPGAPVPVDLGAEVNAASSGTDLHPPFRSQDHVLRGAFVDFIHADNRALLTSIAAAGVPPRADLERWKARARRRGLIL